MIKAKVEWRHGVFFLNYLETGEAIITKIRSNREAKI